MQTMALRRPTDNCAHTEESSKSFPTWFPFRFGKENAGPRTDPDLTAHDMIPSPEQIWMCQESDLNPDLMKAMKCVLSEALEKDDEVPYSSALQSAFSPRKSSASPALSPQKNISIIPRGERRTKRKQRAVTARPAQQASSPPSGTTRPQAIASLKCCSRTSSPPPTVRTIQGKRVTIVSEELKVMVVDLLTPEECDLARCMADDHVRQVNESGNRVPTWRTLYTYTKQDLPCGEVKNLNTRVTDGIMEAVKGIVGEAFGNPKGAAKLRARSWKEPHLLLYQHLEGKPLHTGVEMHYDGCDVTWNCVLSKSSEYDGGGTYIRALRKTVRLEQGQVLIHPGELYHKGCDITNGVRALIVCFMDGFDPKIKDPSSSSQDNEAFEENVRMY
jgi:hypothetical protein